MKTKFWIGFSILVVLALGLGPALGSVDVTYALQESTPTTEPQSKIFLPISMVPTTIQGKVVDADNRPLSGVSVVSQNGQVAVTDGSGDYVFSNLAPGDYALAPELEGYMFTPAVRQVDAQTSDPVDFTGVAACTNAIVNGGFETNDAWQLPVTVWPADYTPNAAHTGLRSLRTGIVNTADNVYSYSSARQPVTIPSTATSAVLRLWLYPVSGEVATTQALAEAPAMRPMEGQAADSVALGSDVQYVLVLDANDTVLETLLWMRSDNKQWTFHEFNLTKYAGRSIKIQVGTYNDGLVDVTSMYVDDVSLEICDTGVAPTPTPGPTPTPTTPAPGVVCTNYFANSGFESDSAWGIPITVYPASYSTSAAHSGVRSMRTGIPFSTQNKFSYSDAYQLATIPSNATSAKLSMWVLPKTEEVVQTGALSKGELERPSVDEVFGESTAVLSNDAQYVMVLDAYGNILQFLYWNLSNATTWQYLEFNLTGYAGRTIRIQFGTYNNGVSGVTSMYVDDAIMDVCSGTAPTATPVAPTPTPVPSTCTERIANNGFEWVGAWGIPITNFSAGYSTYLQHTGAQSMRTGIFYLAHNRYSYSDAYQTVFIPATATKATLGMWVYPISGETTSLAIAEKPTGALDLAATNSGDVQYILLLDAYGNWIDTLLWQRKNTQTWTYVTYDLTAYRGTYVRLQFGTYNNGDSGVTAMYVDDVSLQTCP